MKTMLISSMTAWLLLIGPVIAARNPVAPTALSLQAASNSKLEVRAEIEIDDPFGDDPAGDGGFKSENGDGGSDTKDGLDVGGDNGGDNTGDGGDNSGSDNAPDTVEPVDGSLGKLLARDAVDTSWSLNDAVLSPPGLHTALRLLLVASLQDRSVDLAN